MSKKLFFLQAIFFLIFSSSSILGQTISDTQKKELKTLVLIIASDGNRAYLELQKIWRSYMHSDPEHFEVYFIRGNPDLVTPFEVDDYNLIVKTEESYMPGIINKTILSLEALLPRLDEFDFVIRTNLSSFYVFPKLLTFLKSLPRKNCYCGWAMHTVPDLFLKFGWINFASGSGFILSTDLARRLVHEKENIFKYNTELPDDTLIGLFFQSRNIQIIPAERVDFLSRKSWYYEKNKIKNSSFHFRAKSNHAMRSPENNYDDELYINQQLLKFFYPQVIDLTSPASVSSPSHAHKKIFMGLIIKNNDALIPDFLKNIESLDHDKRLINLQINLYNSRPEVKTFITNWIEKNRNYYSQIIFIDNQLLSDFTHDAKRFRLFAEIKNSFLHKAKELKDDFCFITESDTFLSPSTLKHLINKDKPIIVPLLNPIPLEESLWRNFWLDVTENGYYKNHPDYYSIAYRASKSTFKVACVSGAYLIKTNLLEDLSFIDGKDDWEFMAFSAAARKLGIDQFICNEEEFGYILHFNHALDEAEMKNFSLLPNIDLNEYLFNPIDQPMPIHISRTSAF